MSFLRGNSDRPLTTGAVPSRTMLASYALSANKNRIVLRSRSTPNSGGYDELSIGDRAGQRKIFPCAQCDIEQLILNDSHTSIGNDRHEWINRDSRSLVENDCFGRVNTNSSSPIRGDELHTAQGERHTQIDGNELLFISGTGGIAVDGTWIVQAGLQACVTAINVLVDTGVNLTLKADGQYIAISSAGIFSSVPIVRGGAPMAGIAPQQVLQALVEAAQTVVANSLPFVAAVG